MFTMMLTAGAVLLLCLIFTGVETKTDQDKPNCNPVYSRISPHHTMCLTDNPDASKLSVTEKMIKKIVKRHNQIRRSVFPYAVNMQKMHWSSQLATLAEKWAMQCPTGHEDDKNKRAMPIPGLGMNVGQNYAVGKKNIEDAITSWSRTSSEWKHGQVTTLNTTALPYVQQIWASAAYIGCGYAKCGDTKYFICDYYTGLTISEAPYKEGRPCVLCTRFCDDKLCDCRNPIPCLNMGTFNFVTCQCDCVAPKCGFICDDDCPDTDA